MSLLDEVLTSNPAAAPRRSTPPGDYTMVVKSHRFGKNPKNENENVEFTFGLLDATGGQELEGVDLSRAQAYYTLWITAGTRDSGIVERVLKEMGVWQEGATIRDMVEAGVGASFDGTVELRKKDVESGQKYPRLDVTRIGEFINRPNNSSV